MQESFNSGSMPVPATATTTAHPLQQQQQQQLSLEHNQQQNMSYPQSYSGLQTYDGWPGMALKQIMGQIDLINFQNQNCPVQAKWAASKDLMNNNNNCNSYMQMPSAAIMQQQQQHAAYKSQVAYENAQQIESDNSMAWLGPQLWNRRIGVDVSNGGAHQVAMYNDMKIKTEMGSTSDGDSNPVWYSNCNSNRGCSSSNNSKKPSVPYLHSRTRTEIQAAAEGFTKTAVCNNNNNNNNNNN